VKGRRVEEPEAALIRAASDGDAVAFERLVRHLQDHVWRFLCHFLGDHALAEDVAQETFLRVYRRLPTYQARAKFSTWVFQIARNAGVDALRSRARRDRLVTAVPPPAPSTPAPAGTTEVAEAVASLRPKPKEALLLVEVYGLTYQEAADVLGVPEGTVKSRVHQARRDLTAWLASEEQTSDV
jgi:RNA polymerase sigma-70 factor (ECF subfamily)